MNRTHVFCPFRLSPAYQRKGPRDEAALSFLVDAGSFRIDTESGEDPCSEWNLGRSGGRLDHWCPATCRRFGFESGNPLFVGERSTVTLPPWVRRPNSNSSTSVIEIPVTIGASGKTLSVARQPHRIPLPSARLADNGRAWVRRAGGVRIRDARVIAFRRSQL